MRKYKGLLHKSIALVGLMGAGKSRVGSELARLLGVPFLDADSEIERAAGCGVADYFEQFGEKAFRDGERKVIQRLLDEQVCVLATGGGAFVQEETRRLIKSSAISVWIKADIDTLVDRTLRLDRRPLLQGGDRRKILERLMKERYPFYEQADITVEASPVPPRDMAESIVREIMRHSGSEAS